MPTVTKHFVSLHGEMSVQLSNHGNTVMSIAVDSHPVTSTVTPQDEYAYTLRFPADPPKLQADADGTVTWARLRSAGTLTGL